MFRKIVLALAILVGFSAAASADMKVKVSRSTVEDLPFTIIYPQDWVANPVSNRMVASVSHPDLPFKCEVLIDDMPREYSAQELLDTLDDDIVNTELSKSFPGFKLTKKGLTKFASGPALYYEGVSEASDYGLPIHLFHGESVKGTQRHTLECLAAEQIAEDARPTVEVIFANFSTRSDGTCCVEPEASGK
ncbi:MAG: hypothetical protein H6883_06760 [Rhodobiaceae bacterium]|nr:hypothetical protein [Rhodobiaceae bacterium]